MSKVFPNSKPKLLGEGEDSIGIIDTPAVAGLTGDLVMSKISDTGYTDIPATSSGTFIASRSRVGSNGSIRFTLSNITTPVENPNKSTLVIIVAASNAGSVASNSTKDWVLKRDATTIDSFSLVGASPDKTEADIHIFIDTNPPAGTFDYTLVEDDGNGYGGIGIQLFFILGTDTHAGFIDTVAIAGKQINTPDTHTTHEQEILPD